MIVTLLPLDEQLIRRTEERTGERIHVCESIEDGQEMLSQAEILMGWGNITEETIARCKNLKWIYVLGAGVENLPYDMLRERGIAVTNARGVHGKQMAEQTLGMMILFSRRLLDFLRAKERKEWRKISEMNIDELTGKTLCIIGAGSIGSELARKAQAFDMRVIGIKNTPEALENFDEVTGRENLLDVLGQSDYVVMITPLTTHTYKMIGEKEFAAMKRSTVFINISRGDTVDEEAMIKALQTGIIAGAGLDVFHDEPLPAASPLWDMENVVITPHMAGVSPYYMDRAMEYFCDNLPKFRAGEKMNNAIDFERKY